MKTTCVTVQLPRELAGWLRQAAAARFCSMSTMIRELVETERAGTTTPPPLPPAQTALSELGKSRLIGRPLPEDLRRREPETVTLAEAARLSPHRKGGLK